MENENKFLIEYKKEGFFSKVLKFLKNIFGGKEKNKNIKNNTSVQSMDGFHMRDNLEIIQVIENIEINKKLESVNLKKEGKNEFFKLYNDYKNGVISSKEISLYDLVRINRMLDEERKIYKR